MKRRILVLIFALSILINACGAETTLTDEEISEMETSEQSSIEDITSDIDDVGTIVYSEGKSNDTLYLTVPQINQKDFSEVKIGTSDISVSGNLITSLCMIESYEKKEWITPDDFIKEHSDIIAGNGVVDVNSFGQQLLNDELFSGETFDFEKMSSCLKTKSCVVLVKVNHPSIYGNDGHYFIIVGVNKDGYLVRESDTYVAEKYAKCYRDSGEYVYNIYEVLEALGTDGTMYVFQEN